MRAVKTGPDGELAWDKLEHIAVYKGHLSDGLTPSSNGGATIHAYGEKAPREAYGLLNISAGVSLDEQFEISAFCRNCTDEVYNSLIFSSVFQPGSKDAFLGNPAEYGVSLRFEW